MKLAIISRRPPYGDINAAEAVRHALGAASDDMEVSLIMVDSGVLLSRKEQDEAGTGFTNLGAALKDCIDMGVSVYAESASLRATITDNGRIIEGVKVINGSEASEIVKEADHTLIF